MTNYIDPVRVWPDSGNTADLVASSGSVPKCKFLEYNESGYLIAGYCDDNPMLIKWADIGDITAWGSGNYGSALLRHSPNPIRGLKNLNEFTVAYKKDAIYFGRPVDTSDIISWELQWTGIGLMTDRALVEQRGTHYLMGTDDFYSFKGVRPDSIADMNVKREVFSRLNREKEGRCFALLMEEYDEVWFFIVVSGQNWPTEIWKYNYRNNFWYLDTCSAVASACLYYEQSSEAWNDNRKTWNQQVGRWNEITEVNSPIGVIGNALGYTHKIDGNTPDDDGVAVNGAWESMDFAADEFEKYKRWLQMDFEAKGNSVTVEYSTDYGSIWHTIKTDFVLTQEWPTKHYTIYFDVVARNIRFRFSNKNLGETFYLRQFYPYWLSREETKR
jgi:hypothetical protein